MQRPCVSLEHTAQRTVDVQQVLVDGQPLAVLYPDCARWKVWIVDRPEIIDSAWGLDGRAMVYFKPAAMRLLGLDVSEFDWNHAHCVPANRVNPDREDDAGDEEHVEDPEEALGKGHHHSAEWILRTLAFGSLLRKSVDLKQGINAALEVLSFGADRETQELLETLRSRVLPQLPYTRTIRRAVVKLDLASMLWWRHRYENGMSFIGALAVDASEQRQYHYMLSRFDYVAYAKHWTIEDKLQNDWSEFICSTHLPIGCLGYGESTFVRKFRAMVHEISMITGSEASMDIFRSSVIGFMTDQASTERKLADAPAMRRPSQLEELLTECEKGNLHIESADVGAYFFPRALGATDPMHAIWNTFEAAVKHCLRGHADVWTPYESQLRGMLAYLGHRGRRSKWLLAADLTREERELFTGWKYRLVDWKWQYMADMWKVLTRGAPAFLSKVSVAELQQPVSSSDDRVGALDNQSLDAIALAVSDADFVLKLQKCTKSLLHV